MSPDEIQQLKGLIVASSLYYGHQIPDQVLGLYVEDLVDLPYAQVAQAVRDVRRDPKTTRFPLPAVIRQRIEPQADPEAEAVEAANRIIEAVSKIGPYQLEAARDFIGSLGWRVVQMEGGWHSLCEMLNYDNLGMLKSQWRNLAKAQLSRQSSGMYDAPSIPKLKGTGQLVQIGSQLEERLKQK